MTPRTNDQCAKANAARRFGIGEKRDRAVKKVLYAAYTQRHLGAKLFSRNTRRLKFTESGSDYYGRCVRPLEDLEAM